MKPLYESILDQDFDITFPGEGLPGFDKLVKIFTVLKNGKETQLGPRDFEFSAKQGVFKDLKNTLDKLAKKPVKMKPTKKWAIVSFTENTNKSNPYTDINIYSLIEGDWFNEYHFRCWPTDTSLWTRKGHYNSIGYYDVYRKCKYCIPDEVCKMIDFILEK